MSRKNLIAIVSIVLFSFLVVIVLYVSSEEPFSYRQNFERRFGYTYIHQRNILDLGGNTYYIAGVSGSQVFLGNQNDSLKVLVTDTLLSEPQPVRLTLSSNEAPTLFKVSASNSLTTPSTETLRLKGSYIDIDSPFFYIKAGNLPGIFRGSLGQWHATRIADDIPFFSNAVPLNNHDFAFMAIGTAEGSTTRENILCKISADNDVKLNPEILEGQMDNLYSTMGVLRYSKTLDQLVYTYTYRNQYLVIDPDLKLQRKANTIDTVSHAHVKPVQVDKNTYSLASTPALVNSNAQVYENLLFIHSNLMASNEKRETFDMVTVIDVYDIPTNTYQYSFYLADYQGIKMKTFKIIEDRILAIFDQYVISYSFRKRI